MMRLFGRRKVLTVMAVAAFMLASNCGRAGSLDNYHKIKNGMRRAEVESLLGKGTEEASDIVDVNRSVDSRVSLIVARKEAISVFSTTMPEKVATDIAALQEVAAVGPGLLSCVSVEELGSDSLGIEAWPVGNHRFGELKAMAGEILSEKDRGQRAVIVGKELARLKSVKVGDTLTISDEKFHVVGIFASASDVENRMLVMLLPEAQKLFGFSGKITACTVNLKDNSSENVDRVGKIIETTIAEANGLKRKLRARPPDPFFQYNAQTKMSMVCWKDKKQVVCITFVNGLVALKALVRL